MPYFFNTVDFTGMPRFQKGLFCQALQITGEQERNVTELKLRYHGCVVARPEAGRGYGARPGTVQEAYLDLADVHFGEFRSTRTDLRPRDATASRANANPLPGRSSPGSTVLPGRASPWPPQASLQRDHVPVTGHYPVEQLISLLLHLQSRHTQIDFLASNWNKLLALHQPPFGGPREI